MGQPSLHDSGSGRLDGKPYPGDDDVRGINRTQRRGQLCALDQNGILADAAQRYAGAQAQGFRLKQPAALGESQDTALRARVQRSLQRGGVIDYPVAHRAERTGIDLRLD